MIPLRVMPKMFTFRDWAARALAARGAVDPVFLSCTNLRILDVIADLEAALDLSVLSSN